MMHPNLYTCVHVALCLKANSWDNNHRLLSKSLVSSCSTDLKDEEKDVNNVNVER